MLLLIFNENDDKVLNMLCKIIKYYINDFKDGGYSYV